jgi:hypothetical protein
MIDTKLKAFSTELRPGLQAEIASSATDYRVDCNSIARTNALDPCADIEDFAGQFVPQDHGRIGPFKVAPEDVNVGTTNPHRLHFDKNLMFGNRGTRIRFPF